MKDGEPAVLGVGPRSAQHPAPPVTVFGLGEAPGGRRRGDLGESCLVGPGQEAASGIGLAAVGAGSGLVQVEPLVELGQPWPQAKAL